MSFQYIPFIWPLIASAAITTALAVYTLNHNDVRGALPFGVCMLLTALWSAGYALEIAGTDRMTMLFWAKVQSMCYSLNPVVWLVMVFQFIERDHWVTRRSILLLLILPVITIALAWTNDLHGLIWQDAHVAMQGTFPVLTKTFGPWFWVIAVYSYLLNIVSESLLAISLRRKSALYREQSLALFVGLALLFLYNALYLCGIRLFYDYDPTPMVAGVSGLIIAWGIFRYRLFDIIPVARESIIENMIDGLIVLDAQYRIADMNRAASAIFGCPSTRAIGRGAKAILDEHLVFPAVDRRTEMLPNELIIGQRMAHIPSRCPTSPCRTNGESTAAYPSSFVT